MQLTPHLTRIAADAIIAQMAMRATDEATRCANIDGVEHELTVHYSTDWTRDSDGNATECEITGAWAEDPDTGNVIWAGSKPELETLIGERLVDAWEADLAQSKLDGGRW